MINKVLLMEFFKDDDIKLVDKDFYIKSQMKNDVIKYITILEEENETYKTRCEKAYKFIMSKHNWYGDEEEDNEEYLFELEDFEELLSILNGD